MVNHEKGLVVVLIFYVVIAGVGIWASMKHKTGEGQHGDMLANRDISFFVGLFTMTATWVCGGYINGTAEEVYKDSKGLLWVQAPIGYSISLIVGGVFFAKKMRERRYCTMIDPLQQTYGKIPGALLVLPAATGELFWSAAVLSALGSTLAVIIGLPLNATIIVSATICVLYTLFGGLYAVAYTDVAQLALIIVGLFMAIPNIMTSDYVDTELMLKGIMNETSNAWSGPEWLGEIKSIDAPRWVDNFIMLIFGGLPWQAYFQRVLSANSANNARIQSVCAGFACMFMAIPSIFIGAAAKATDWDLIFAEEANATGRPAMKILDNVLHCDGVRSDGYCPFSIVPITFKYLCYPIIAYFGLGAVSASVMSSADSSLLSISTLLTLNVFVPIQEGLGFREDPKWTPRVLKMFICIVGVIATTMAVKLKSVYKLFHMSGDIVYALLFPQLTAAMYMPTYVNWFGSTMAFITGVLLRFLSGEPFLGIDAVIEWPGFITAEESQTGEHKQMFMFRTVSMVIVFVVLLVSSQAFEFVQRKRGKVVRNGHNEWQKNIVKSELTDSYGSSDSNTDAFIESSAKMLPDKR